LDSLIDSRIRDSGRAGWKAVLERSLMPVAFRSQAYRPARYLNRRKAVILTYHGFTDARVHDGIENHEGKHVHVDDFRGQIEWLARHYRVLPLEDVVRRLGAGQPLPDRAAVVSIDDGYRSTYTLAFPVLREMGVPAAVFFATEFVDAKRYLWTDRVEYAINRARPGTYAIAAGSARFSVAVADGPARAAGDHLTRSTLKALPQADREAGVESLERAVGASLQSDPSPPSIYQPVEWSEADAMARSGVMVIGSHTHTHVIVSRTASDAAAVELTTSKRIIEDRLGLACDLFCYPNGRRGDFDDRTKAQVRAAGYRCALTTVHGMNGAGADVFELKRYPVSRRKTTAELAVRLSGVVELPSAIGAWRSGRRHG
jgi:peptidoglycan/xylan/chitin deacetylase (PgdA/CDA1 family)